MIKRLLTEREARLLSPLQLAYIGDTVHDLLVRTRLIASGQKVHAMHKAAAARVCAGAQAAALARVLARLTPEEADIVRRGRNAHARHAAPRHADPADYAQATGFEALLGYLYLTGQRARLCELLPDEPTPDTPAGREEPPCPERN